MQIFDKKLKKYFPNYMLQSLLATITLTIILYFENIFTRTAIIASLGATTFIIFAMPEYTTAQPRKVIGGHIIGIIVGVFCFYITSWAQRDSNSRLVLFNYTGHPYNYFPLVADQIFAKIVVKRFGLNIVIKNTQKNHHGSTIPLYTILV